MERPISEIDLNVYVDFAGLAQAIFSRVGVPDRTFISNWNDYSLVRLALTEAFALTLTSYTLMHVVRSKSLESSI